MTEPALRELGGIAYREAGPEGAPVVLLLHGHPESSFGWRAALPAIAEAGWRAIAPDLPGYGDSPARRPGTWEHQVENVEELRRGLGLERVALVVHDWGGLIGLRWACEHPEAICALVISNTGFFPDGKWHGMAKALRTEGTGEEIVENMTRELFGGALRQSSPALSDAALDEFWKCAADADRRQSQLDLYRSGDFEKLEPYRGRLASLGVPTLILWGARDEFAPVAGAHRFAQEIPHAAVVVVEEAGHFLMEDAPTRGAAEIAGFLRGLDV